MYQIHFVSPNSQVPPRPEGEKIKTLQQAELWVALLNDCNRGLNVSGYYKALKVRS